MKLFYYCISAVVFTSLASMNAHTSDIATIQGLQSVEAPRPIVPSLSLQLMLAAKGELNQQLLRMLVDPLPTAEVGVLKGKRIAILSTNGVEELELTLPQRWARERGATIDLISPHVDMAPNSAGVQMPDIARTHVLTVKLMENAGWVKIDRYLGEQGVTADKYDGVILTGGVWNPDTLRTNPDALAFVKQAVKLHKPLFAICHGPLMLISAKVLQGRKVAGYHSIRDDLINAGATVFDQPCVVDGNLITGRTPLDLPQCLEQLKNQIVGSGH